MVLFVFMWQIQEVEWVFGVWLFYWLCWVVMLSVVGEVYFVEVCVVVEYL